MNLRTAKTILTTLVMILLISNVANAHLDGRPHNDIFHTLLSPHHGMPLVWLMVAIPIISFVWIKLKK